MNNKLIAIIGGGILIIGVFLLFNNSGSEVENPLKENKIQSQKDIKSNKNISDNSHFMSNTSSYNNADKNTKKENNNYSATNNFEKSTHLAGKIDYDKNNNEFIFDEKSFYNFADNKNLEEVESIDENTKIYAKNPPLKSEFAPPMPPVLIRVKFKEKTKIIPVKSELVSANKKLYVVNKDNKKIEVKEIPTKDISSFTPPAIGQN